jgi:hypothetical protein
MNREPSSELVSAVTPVKTEKESSAATPATPNAAMPGAAPHSLALAFRHAGDILLSLEYEYPRKKKVKWGEKIY